MEIQEALNIASYLPVTLTAPELTEAEFLALCEKFPNSRLEYSGDGTLIIMPPTDPETAERTWLIVYALVNPSSVAVEGPADGFVLNLDGIL
jgi:Uma2 family endonuclease